VALSVLRHQGSPFRVLYRRQSCVQNLFCSHLTLRATAWTRPTAHHSFSKHLNKQVSLFICRRRSEIFDGISWLCSALVPASDHSEPNGTELSIRLICCAIQLSQLELLHASQNLPAKIVSAPHLLDTGCLIPLPDCCASRMSGEDTKPNVEGEDTKASVDTITIRVRDQTGEETFFKVKKSTRMEKVFNTYAQVSAAPFYSISHLQVHRLQLSKAMRIGIAVYR
jgi:hypothetical protein